ncbi:MAG: winged helix-turn-helix domain-containing protein, partial [Clostridia bacterium]
MNKKNVIQCIDRFGPINRSAIAKMVGLSIPAVMDITEELIAHGLVTSAMREGSGQGKRPEVLSLSGDRFRLVGVDVGRTT